MRPVSIVGEVSLAFLLLGKQNRSTYILCISSTSLFFNQPANNQHKVRQHLTVAAHSKGSHMVILQPFSGSDFSLLGSFENCSGKSAE
jgi:hypothetical protein